MQLNTDDPNVFRVVRRICVFYKVDYSGTLERKFLSTLLLGYKGEDNMDNLEQWLKQEIQTKFPALNERPSWLQSPEWPFTNDVPMVFIGQIDVHPSNTPDFSGYFHDSTSFYVFMPQGQGSCVVVMQQM